LKCQECNFNATFLQKVVFSVSSATKRTIIIDDNNNDDDDDDDDFVLVFQTQ